MERTLLLIAGGFVLLMLVYVAVERQQEKPQDLAALSAAVPNDPWYQEAVLASEKPVLVEFTATWCGYCRQLAVVLEDIKKDYGDRIEIVPVDVDQHPEVSAAYGINGIPVLMVVSEGKVVAMSPGMMRYETVEKLIKPYLADAKAPVERTESSPAAEPSSSRLQTVGRTMVAVQ